MPKTTTPEPFIAPACRDGEHLSCDGPPCECMCHDGAPAPSQRGTLIKALLASWRVADDPTSRTMARITAGRDVDTILAALAADHGDLCERMAKSIAAEWSKTAIVCEHTQVITFGPLADAALAVRDEHTAHLAARLAVAERTAETEVAEHQVTRERADQWRRQAQQQRAQLAALLGIDPGTDWGDILDQVNETRRGGQLDTVRGRR